FINAGLTDELADFGHPHIVFGGLYIVGVVVGGHGSELIAIELPVVKAVPGLSEENGALGFQADQKGKDGGQPGKHPQDDHYGKYYVKTPFDKSVDRVVQGNVP